VAAANGGGRAAVGGGVDLTGCSNSLAAPSGQGRRAGKPGYGGSLNIGAVWLAEFMNSIRIDSHLTFWRLCLFFILFSDDAGNIPMIDTGLAH
jgi:hypothetical protein